MELAIGAQRSPPEIANGISEITVVIIPIIIGRILVLQLSIIASLKSSYSLAISLI